MCYIISSNFYFEFIEITFLDNNTDNLYLFPYNN